jgi:gas vesicle protein
MNHCCSHSHFFLGMSTGLIVGSVLGMCLCPSRREIRRVAHKAAKSVNEAVDSLTQVMGG